MALVLLAAASAASAAGMASQISKEGAVTVKVTPITLTPTAATWEFEIVFDTHTAALTGNPAQFAVLVDAQGRRYAPLRWDGDPPGGHHRKGTLWFSAPGDSRDGGGTTPRTGEVERSREQPPRATQGAVAETRRGPIELQLNGVGGVATRSFRWDVR